MTKFKSMTAEAAKTTATRLRVSEERGERYARMCAFDIASNFSDYTERDAYEEIMQKARSLVKRERNS